MKAKIGVLIVTMLLVTLYATRIANASADKNPIFMTAERVKEVITQAVNPILEKIKDLEASLNISNQNITDLQTEVKQLKANQLVTGEAADPNAPQLGIIKYQGNVSEFHFWFTPTQNLLGYIAGHFYHNIYVASVEFPSEWCGITPVVNRAPYNLVGQAGTTVYFKVIDVTAGKVLCF